MRKIVLIFAFVAGTLAVQGQSFQLLNKDATGIGIYGSRIAEYTYQGTYLEMGGIYQGRFEGKLFYDGLKFFKDENSLDNDKAKAGGLGAWITYWAFRSAPASFLDVNLGVEMGLFNYNFENYTYSFPQHEYTGYYGASLGFVSSMKIKMTESWMFEPFLNAYYEMGYEGEGLTGSPVEEGFSGVQCNYGLTVGKRFKNDQVLFATFKVGSANYGWDENFRLGIGYLVPLK